MRHIANLLRKVVVVTAGLLLAGSSPVMAVAPDLKVSPAPVEIGTFFNGQTVTVKSLIPTGAEAVLEVIGTNADEHLMRKGRRGGLWMNVGEIAVHNAPSVYLVLSTNKELLETSGGEAAWGYQSLEKRINFSGTIEDTERSMFMNQFLELKESEFMYASYPGALKVKPASSGQSLLSGEFFLPTNIKPGAYEVALTVVVDGKVVNRARTELMVEMMGFPALLANLAYQHGATYGIIAVVIAIVTGFAMGFLFKGGGGH